MKPELHTKVILTRILSDVLEKKRTLTNVLPDYLKKIKDPRDKSLVQFCAYEIFRDFFRLEGIIKKLVTQPLKNKQAYYLLLIGISQLTTTRMPAYAVVSSTVDAAKKLKLFSVCNLINAVLRAFQRQQVEILAELETNPVTHYAHPEWMILNLQTAWPTQWESICTENNQHAPMWLRINPQKITPAAYLELLSEKNMPIAAIDGSACCLETPVDVELLPGFNEGWVSVQDRAAQMAAELLDLQPQQRVLDACAAPGGKTGHILEKQPDVAELVAIDDDPLRVIKIRENLTRLQLTATVLVGDAAEPKLWWDGKLFDRILLDAPCSATGVVRRHPDIKVLRQPQDIAELAHLQLALLKALWPLLKPQGKLLYATCSILPQENQRVVTQFCQEQADASQVSGRQIFPGEEKMDGFFYALLEKKAAS
ncbi:MAG: 16S rRNA (cytosine(967)-C(5))-methyltransferase RsmB [Gammaproteobacteria bacterium]